MPAENFISLSYKEPASEQLCKHSRDLRDKKEKDVLFYSKLRWYRGNQTFSSLFNIGTGAFFYIQN